MSLQFIASAVLVIVLIVAALYDVKYRGVPRRLWVPCWFIAVPIGIGSLFLFILDYPLFGIVNCLIIGFVLILSFFMMRVGRFNTGDFIGYVAVFLTLTTGFLPFLVLVFVSLFSLFTIFILVLWRADLRTYPIPYLLLLCLGTIGALVLASPTW